MKPNGISFMVRIRNEEKTLEDSILSLFSLKIPHEINLILHRCTDKSEKIAFNLANVNTNIKVYTYDKELSRPGYENLATDAESDHSFVKYSNYCLSKSNYAWTFRWDADFIASYQLVQLLNMNTWNEQKTLYKIHAINSTSKNCEPYLTSCLTGYKKFLFWEVPVYTNNHTIHKLDEHHYITHNSEINDIKSYWKEAPWYETEDSEEAREVKQRIEYLTEEFGKEPEGMARASNPVCDEKNINIINANPSYINIYS